MGRDEGVRRRDANVPPYAQPKFDPTQQLHQQLQRPRGGGGGGGLSGGAPGPPPLPHLGGAPYHAPPPPTMYEANGHNGSGGGGGGGAKRKRVKKPRDDGEWLPPPPPPQPPSQGPSYAPRRHDDGYHLQQHKYEYELQQQHQALLAQQQHQQHQQQQQQQLHGHAVMGLAHVPAILQHAPLPQTAVYQQHPPAQFHQPPHEQQHQHQHQHHHRQQQQQQYLQPAPAPPPTRNPQSRPSRSPSASPAPIAAASTAASVEPSSSSSSSSIPPSAATLPESASAATTSVFEGAPAPIQTFAEAAEHRRRNNATPEPTPTASSTPSTPQNGLPGRIPPSGGRAPLSVFDLFFPTARATRRASGESGAAPSATKRRRRGPPSPPSTRGAAPGRRSRGAAEAAGEDPALVDEEMLQYRYGVDVLRLIPQGLVDHVDARLDPAFLARTVAAHVENWVRRSGTGRHGFLQELTALLNAYYPCNHPTLLDDILAGFVMKRPECMGPLLAPMIDKLVKTGESVRPARYPVLEALLRQCRPPPGLCDPASGASASTIRAQRRHDLGALAMLQCVVERNSDKFGLSPWLAAAAVACREEVLDAFTLALLSALDFVSHPTSVPGAAPCWRIPSPVDQIFEILQEEKQWTRQGDDGAATGRLAGALLHQLVAIQARGGMTIDLASIPFACEALEVVFSVGPTTTTSHGLLRKWLQAWTRDDASGRLGAWTRLVETLVRGCSRLSIKKTRWFVRHVVSFAMVEDLPSSWATPILLDRDYLLFGGVDKAETERLSQMRPDGCEHGPIVLGTTPQTNEKITDDDITAHLRGILSSGRRYGMAPEKMARFLDHAIDTWDTAGGRGVAVPWGYVWNAVRLVDQVDAAATAAARGKSELDAAFARVAGFWLTRHVLVLLGQSSTTSDAERVLLPIHRLLQVTLRSTGASARALHGRLLQILCDPVNKSARLIAPIKALFGKLVTQELAPRPRGSFSRQQRHASRQEGVLVALRGICMRDDGVGAFARHQLASRRCLEALCRVLAPVEDAPKTSSSHAALALVEVLVARANVPADTIAGLCESLLGLLFDAPPRDHAAMVLEAIAQSGPAHATELLWAVLRYGPNKRRRDVAARGSPVSSSRQAHEVTRVCADLCLLAMARVEDESSTVVDQVVRFIQRDVEAAVEGNGAAVLWDPMLLRVLEGLVQWRLSDRLVDVIQVVVVAAAATGAGARMDPAHEVVALQLVQCLGLALLASDAPTPSPSWRRGAALLVSDHMRSSVRRILETSASGTAVGLARVIATATGELEGRLLSR